MYIVQRMAVDVAPNIVRNVGDELTKDDVKKVGKKRMKSMLATRRLIEIEVLASEPEVSVISEIKLEPRAQTGAEIKVAYKKSKAKES